MIKYPNAAKLKKIPTKEKFFTVLMLYMPTTIPKTEKITIGSGGVLKKGVKTNRHAMIPNNTLIPANIFCMIHPSIFISQNEKESL